MFSTLNIRIGFFLALRQIKRSNIWTSALIIFVMVLTFLNLVIISGILIGLVQGIIDATRAQYIGDLTITNLDGKSYIDHSPDIIETARSLPQVKAVSARYMEGGTVEAEYKARTKFLDKPNTASAQIVGIDPVAEDVLTGLSHHLVKGEYLAADDYDQILIGAYLLKQYLDANTPSFGTLDNVDIGSKLRLRVGGAEREVTVKGIVKTKVDELNVRIFMTESQLRGMIGRTDFAVDEISLRLDSPDDAISVKNALIANGAGDYAKVQTFDEGLPKFVTDIRNTFAILGNIISSIGLIAASITIFIVIFINAVTRRKFIGILKGIGISAQAIETSYVFQSIFYATVGSAIGLVILYGFLQPFIARHPIDFPFSDGVLVASFAGTFARIALLIFATIIAGYVPARMIVRKNTLDSILGRN